MAFADFHERAATSASQMLAGFTPDAFERILNAHAVCLAIDGAAAGSHEGRATLDMCVRLLARLHPVLALVPLDAAAADATARAGRLAASINPAIGIRDSMAGGTVCVAIGGKRPVFDGPVFFTGSDGWTAKLSRSHPVGSGSSRHPYGAGAAACIAAANVFRTIFGGQLAGGSCDEDAELSLLTYTRSAAGADLDPAALDLGAAHLVGLGAIGNGAIWAFAGTDGLCGTLHLIDDEAIDLPNLQRYVLATRLDVEAVKVDLAATALAGTALRAVAHRTTFASYVDGLSDRRLERVAVALDTAKHRIAVQASLPEWIANAWTQPTDLGVSRHRFGDGGPCLACLYIPTGPTKDEDQLVAEELAMPEAKMEVRRMLQTGEPVGLPFLARIATAMGIPEEPLARFADQPLREFRSVAICGGLALRLSEGRHAAPAVVPMPFQSALAGIMLAAEMLKHAAGQIESTSAATRINLLRPLGAHLRDPMVRDSTGRCICADVDFLAAYRLKYAVRRRRAPSVGSGQSSLRGS